MMGDAYVPNQTPYVYDTVQQYSTVHYNTVQY